MAREVSLWRSIWDWVWPICIGVAVAFSVQHWLFGFATVPTGSMSPTIPNPCYILDDHLATELHAPYRGEVVLFHWPDNPKLIFVKRIIGMPGDTVHVTYNKVYINGKLLDVPSAVLPNIKSGTWHVPAGHYFMMGDNRSISDDSRDWIHPYVARAAIIGRADFVIFPFNKMSRIPQ